EIEQTGKRIAQIETATAAVADVEHAAKLRIQLRGVVKIGVLPVYEMADGCFGASFRHGAVLRDGAAVAPSSILSRSETLCRARGPEAPRKPVEPDQSSSFSAFWKRPACDRSALARVSNQVAISSNPSSRAALAMPGYISV